MLEINCADAIEMRGAGRASKTEFSSPGVPPNTASLSLQLLAEPQMSLGLMRSKLQPPSALLASSYHSSE